MKKVTEEGSKVLSGFEEEKKCRIVRQRGLAVG